MAQIMVAYPMELEMKAVVKQEILFGFAIAEVVVTGSWWRRATGGNSCCESPIEICAWNESEMTIHTCTFRVATKIIHIKDSNHGMTTISSNSARQV